jgi:hypothetical protein
MLASSFPLLSAIWFVLCVFLFFVYWFIWITVLIDIFSNHEMNGFKKVLWILFSFTFIGLFIYLVVHGGEMQERRIGMMKQRQQAFDQAVQNAGGSNTADQLHKLSELKDKGVLTDAEFQAQKAKLLNA